MKNKVIVLALAVLIFVFVAVWVGKANNPSKRPSTDSTQSTQWYDKTVKTKADSGWILDPEIPGNYIPVPGEKETYMVVDTSGNISAYRHREKMKDGTWVWSDVDMNKTYQIVSETDNGYVITSDERYVRYLRNPDNSYAYVDCDSDGNDTDNKDASTIPSNYICVSGNVYAVYNEYGVLIGYRERIIDENGNYIWVVSDKPSDAVLPDDNNENSNISNENSGNNSNIFNKSDNNSDNITEEETKQEYNSDGTYTQTTSYTEKKQEGNYTVTYKTTVIKVFDKDGKLISTKKDGPTEIARTMSINAGNDAGTALDDLSSECYRMSQKVTYNTDLANSILTNLNEERTSLGLSAVSMDEGSLYRLAQIKCANMAIDGNADKNSSLYGTLAQAALKYGVSLNNSSESCIMTYSSDVDGLHAYLQAKSDSRENRMSASLSSIAIVVVNRNGYTFVYECYN